jgi:hypothetical protein
MVRELVPAVVGLGAVAVLTAVSSHQALGVLPEPTTVEQSACPGAAMTVPAVGPGTCPTGAPVGLQRPSHGPTIPATPS